jgi:hypothetical protein
MVQGSGEGCIVKTIPGSRHHYTSRRPLVIYGYIPYKNCPDSGTAIIDRRVKMRGKIKIANPFPSKLNPVQVVFVDG